MSKPFLIDAIIGNGQSLLTMGSNARFYRFFWPTVGGPQHLAEMQLGVKSSAHHETSWVHDHHWQHVQKYQSNTNIVYTTAVNDFLGLKITFSDLVHPENDVVVRDISVENIAGEKSITLLNFSSFEICGQQGMNGVLFDFGDDMLVHYRSGYHFALGANIPVTGYQCGNHSFTAASRGYLTGGDIGMAPDGCLSWDLGEVKPGTIKSLSIYICPGHNLAEIRGKLKKARQLGSKQMRQDTFQYWQNYLQKCTAIEFKTTLLNDLFKRSLLVFGLLSDKNTGGILAAPEIDEDYCHCGGYGFCWGRDAAFITTAMDKAGYLHLAEKFYLWAADAQWDSGAWLQRYHIDGSFAPSWGLQIDETGSVLWGMWQHYLFTKDKEFLQRVWSSVEKGALFLLEFLDPDTGLPRSSYDLWEERKGEHAYSAAAVYGGFLGAVAIAEVLGYAEKAVQWRRAGEKLRQAITDEFWHPGKQFFIRTVNLEVGQGEYSRQISQGKRADAQVNPKGYVTYHVGIDEVPDISLLGLVEPFKVLAADDERMLKTATLLQEKLSVPRVGGLKRYENDSYIGGNPWIITTLWMALYNIRLKKYEEAKELLEWAAGHATTMGLFPEQVDKSNGQPAWVVPLTWSHAMFLLVALELKEKGVV